MHQFSLGQKVEIDSRFESRHHRVPAYAKGANGVITEICNLAPIPEQIAMIQNPPERVPVYRVKLEQQQLWSDYQGLHSDSLEIEIYQHWLKPIST